MKKHPFHKSLRVELLAGYILIVFFACLISGYMTIRIAESEFRKLLNLQFESTMNYTENFIDQVGQTALILARQASTDSELSTMLRRGDRAELAPYVKKLMEKTTSDSIVILDTVGRVVVRGHDPENYGDSLITKRIVRDAVEKREVGSSIFSVENNFIIYSSSILYDGPKREFAGVLLVGYAINTPFLNNMKKKTDVEISVIRERAVMATTLAHEGVRIENLPIPYLDYQLLLSGKSKVISAKLNGEKYFITARNLSAIERNQPGSLLLSYSQSPLIEIKKGITKRYVLLFCIGFLIAVVVWYWLSSRLLAPISGLVDVTKLVAGGELDTRIDVKESRNEFGILSENFNLMIDSLSEKERALRAHSDDLEKEVKMRTVELEATVVELEEALANVKSLSGLLPICAWCKNVKDDQGYWSKVESYISKHSEAEFTHGLCPACAEKMLEGAGEI